MRTTRTVFLLLLATTLFTACKKKGGGYIRTAPAPAGATTAR